MKNLKKLVGLLVMTVGLTCVGCGNTSLTPVEDSGKKVSIESMSAALPKGWKIDEDALGENNGFVITKSNLSAVTVTVAAEEVDSATADFESAKLLFEETMKALGMTINKSENKTFDLGEGIIISGSAEVTQEFIDNSVALKVTTESDAKDLEKIIGKQKNEVIVYVIVDNTLVAIDGVTYVGDAAAMEEVVTFIINSLEVK